MKQHARYFHGDTASWLQCEIDAQVSSYNQTYPDARQFVFDLLTEGEYDDELSPSQVRAALNLLEEKF